MPEKPRENERLIASNKKAFHDYFILDRFEGGLVLTGTEVKSLREGKANLKDSYVTFKDGEAFLFNAHISPYTHGNRENHDPLRTRKVLLHRREVEKLASQVAEKGLSVV
ncbi:MAG TPA: SsrA-binding protein SmpB, partial [Thermoanaerobaculia bacterium]